MHDEAERVSIETKKDPVPLNTKDVGEPQIINNLKTERPDEDILPMNANKREEAEGQEVISEHESEQGCDHLDANHGEFPCKETITVVKDADEELKVPDYSQINMPPKMLKRGRPKGAETTVIGHPRQKKKKESQNSLVPFSKLSPTEKDRVILGSFSTSLAVVDAIGGHRLLTKEDILPTGKISDAIKDHEMVDIH